MMVMVLKNCKPELSYILAELFNICLKKSCLPDSLKVSLSQLPSFSLHSVVSKIFENLVNNRFVK